MTAVDAVNIQYTLGSGSNRVIVQYKSRTLRYSNSGEKVEDITLPAGNSVIGRLSRIDESMQRYAIRVKGATAGWTLSHVL